MIIKTFFLTSWLIIFSITSAEEMKIQNDYDLPKAELTSFHHSVPYTFFYPIGWSKDGKFSFITEERPGALPICITRYVAKIHDTKKDAEVWSHSIEKGDEGCSQEWVKSEEQESLARVWPELKPAIINQFREYSIEQTQQEIQYLPFAGTKGKIHLVTEKLFDEDVHKFFVENVHVKLGIKEIASFNNMHGCLDVYIEGYLPSPNDDQLALILGCWKMGQHYEAYGPYYLVVGVNY